MKRFFLKSGILGVSLAGALALFSGCASTVPTGLLYMDAKLPAAATSASGASKTGEATCTSILGLIAMGDCSVDAAAEAGHISTIKSVDSKVFSILGIFSTYTTVVKGN